MFTKPFFLLYVDDLGIPQKVRVYKIHTAYTPYTHYIHTSCTMLKRINLTLTNNTLNALDDIVATHGFVSRSDFVRYAIRFWHEKSTDCGGKEDEKYEQIEDIIGLNIPEGNLKKLLDD